MQTNYRSFRDIPIPKNTPVSIFASGPSVGNLSEKEIDHICRGSYAISINYGVLKIPAQLNIWSDKHVSKFFMEHLKDNPKTCDYLVRKLPYLECETPTVDYWFCPITEKLEGCFTLVWLLQLLNRHFPGQKILVFGLDLKFEDEKQVKWYDAVSNWDIKYRQSINLVRQQMELCRSELDQFVVGKGNILNCNPDSGFLSFPKVDYRQVLSL